MAECSGIVEVAGLPRDNATVKLYPASAFASPPAKDTAFPVSGLVATVTSGPSHGGTGAYRFSNIDAGIYYAGADWNGTIVWDSHDVSPVVAWSDAQAEGVPADGVTDAATAITTLIAERAAAVGAGGFAMIYFRRGTYFLNITAEISVPANVGFWCEDGARFVKASNVSAARLFAFVGADTATTTTLSANGTVGAASVSVTSASGLAAGDYVRISDTTFQLSGSLGTTEELNQIVSISGTTVNLKQPLINAYATASTARLTKCNPYRATVRGGEYVVPQGGNGGCLRWELALDNLVVDVVTRGADANACVELKRCRGTRLDRCSAFDGQNQATVGYGFNIHESCYDITIEKFHAGNVRENAISNYSRRVKVLNCTFEDCFDSGVNTHHAKCSDVLIQGNIVVGGGYGIVVGFSTATLAVDRNVQIIGNTILRTQYDAINCTTNPAVGTSDGLVISGNTIEDCGLDGTSRAGILVSRFDGVTIAGNRINGRLNTFLRYGVQLVTVNYCSLLGNVVEGINHGSLTSGGLFWTSCDALQVMGNSIRTVSGNNLWQVTSTDVLIVGNVTDDATVSFDAQPWMEGNQIGSGTTPLRFFVASVGEVAQFDTSGDLVLSDGTDIIVNTTTGTQIAKAAGQKLGFHGAAPTVQVAGATQTFATADGTHAARTAGALTMADGAGTNDGTIAAITADASVIAAFQEVVDQINKLRADLLDTAAFANFTVDGLQTKGLFA